MDPTLTDQITCRLTKFENSLSETRMLCSDAGCTGRYRASSPYGERARLRSLIASVSDRESSRRFTAEFDRINGKLAGLEQEQGSVLRELLLSELRYCVSTLHAGLCWLAIDPVTDMDRSLREAAGVLVLELRNDYDLREIEEMLSVLDDAYRELREEPVHEEQDAGVPGFCPVTTPEGIRYPEKIREE